MSLAASPAAPLVRGAPQLKAEALQALERWEEAVHELEACLHKCGKDDEGLQAKLKEAQRKHKASSRSPDLYKVLGIVEKSEVLSAKR